MSSFTITEEPIDLCRSICHHSKPGSDVPVMFQRLQQEALEPIEPGDDSIVYIENRKKVFVRNSPSFIHGIADLLTIQGIPYRTFKNNEFVDIETLFAGLEPVYTGWYDWCCLSCDLHGQTTEKNFECHPGQTVVTRSDRGMS